MKALCAHFSGKGDASCNKADANRLKDTSHYTNERAMEFKISLTQCQKVYNIYEKEGKEMPEDAKIRFLFKSVQHLSLLGAIEALKALLATNDDITYTQAANHLSIAVFEILEFIAKNHAISGVASTSPKTTIDKSFAIYNADGSIITGQIPTWRNLSQTECTFVIAE